MQLTLTYYQYGERQHSEQPPTVEMLKYSLLSYLYHVIMCHSPCSFLLLTHGVLHSHFTLVSAACSIGERREK